MSMFIFGISNVRITRAQSRALQGIAREHDATFYEITGQQAGTSTGYKSWFSTRNYGSPFNERTASAVQAAVEECGIKR